MSQIVRLGGDQPVGLSQGFAELALAVEHGHVIGPRRVSVNRSSNPAIG